MTVTSTGPSPAAGVVASRVVPLNTITPLRPRRPKSTVTPGAKPVPVIVTTVPPAIGPASGPTPVTVGAP